MIMRTFDLEAAKAGAPDCIEHARNAVELADALIAELDKTNNNEK